MRTLLRELWARWSLWVLVATIALLPTCGSAEPWAEQALARFAAEQEAAGEDVRAFAQYFSVSFAFEQAGWTAGSECVCGRADLIRHLEGTYGYAFDELAYLAVFVDPTGAVVEERLAPQVQVVEQRTYGSDGILASSVSRPVTDLLSGQGEDVADHPFVRLGREYEAAWMGDDPERIAALYATGARVRDGVLGLDLDGRGEIQAHAASASTWARPAGAVHVLDSRRYLVQLLDDAAYRLTLVFGGDDDQPCPGRAAVVLEGRWNGGQQVPLVTCERRFRDIDDVRRCVPDPPPGWWEELDAVELIREAPESVQVPMGDREVEVFRPSPGRIGLLQWAMSRFELAGLQPPELAAVTFESQTRRCEGLGGLVLACGCEPAELLLCLDEAQTDVAGELLGCSLHARSAMLHELGHAWIESNLDDADRAAYLARTGLSSWRGAHVAWNQRGAERSAEVMMWGLLDVELPLSRLGSPPCDDLEQEFRSLTGVDPPTARCRS